MRGLGAEWDVAKHVITVISPNVSVDRPLMWLSNLGNMLQKIEKLSIAGNKLPHHIKGTGNKVAQCMLDFRNNLEALPQGYKNFQLYM